MVEINKFHLFRLSSVKQRQIENQQNKINELKKKAEIQEAKDIKQQEEKIRELKNKLSKAKY
jgi:polyhydroxyalkanoate synthesis regulator phasin